MGSAKVRNRNVPGCLLIFRPVSCKIMEKQAEERQLFVTVTDEFVETRPLEMPIRGSSFSLDGWNFIKCNYEVEM